MTETSLTCKGICVEQRFTSKFAVRVVNIWQTIGRQLATIWPENHYNYTFFGAQLAALQRALRCVQSHRSTSRASWRRPLLRTIFVPCSERTRYKLLTNRSSAVSEAILAIKLKTYLRLFLACFQNFFEIYKIQLRKQFVRT